MRKWDKSYTYAVCTVVFFTIIFLVANQADNRSFRFDGYESYQTALEQWSPESVRKSNESRSNGKLAYFSINCFSEKLAGAVCWIRNALKHFVSSDVKSENEIGAVAVLVFDRVSSGAYRNGATAWHCVCKIYLLDKDTLAVFAEGKV